MGNRLFETMLELYRVPDDKTKWKFSREGIIHALFDPSNKKSMYSTILDEVKAELVEDASKFILNKCKAEYSRLINTSYLSLLEPDHIPEVLEGDTLP